MNGDEFIRFAGLLVARFASDEAALRTAVSRAYYGAYHVAIRLLSRACTERLDHGSVRRLLKESGNPVAGQAGRRLDNLQSDRIKADYRLDAPITLPFAKINIERAVQVNALLATLNDADAFDNFAAGLAGYLTWLKS